MVNLGRTQSLRLHVLRCHKVVFMSESPHTTVTRQQEAELHFVITAVLTAIVVCDTDYAYSRGTMGKEEFMQDYAQANCLPYSI